MNTIEFFQVNSWCIPIVAGFLGLIVGSCLNVIIYRLPIIIENTYKQAAYEVLQPPFTSPPFAINLYAPRSFCPHCYTKIPGRYNIPLLSYLQLRGKSKCCHQKIAIQYPIVEFLSAASSLIVAWHFGVTLLLVPTLILTWSLILLFFIDLKTLLLPDQVTLPLLWLGLLTNSFTGVTSAQDAILGAICGFLFFYLIASSILRIRKIQGLGDGDLKLIASLGAWFGWQLLPALIFIASLLGSIAGLIYLSYSRKKITTQIPFGPCLTTAGFIILLYGQQIYDFQNSLFLFR